MQPTISRSSTGMGKVSKAISIGGRKIPLKGLWRRYRIYRTIGRGSWHSDHEILAIGQSVDDE